jgi:hypothetical protein
MDRVTQVVAWLNAAATEVGRFALAPLADLPGWLSVTIAGAAAGLLLLVIFKYTSRQRSIKAVKNRTKAHLLSLRLFGENAAVTLRALRGVFAGAGRMLLLALVPLLVMLVPVCLIWGQLSLLYEARPLRVGEEAVITMKLNGEGDPSSRPAVALDPADAAEVTVGPVWILSKNEMCWSIKALRGGLHQLVFQVEGETVTKELAVGDGFLRVSRRRPAWDWWDALQHPGEEPFEPESAVAFIEIDYPERSSWIYGSGTWVISWFLVSLVAAFCFRGWVKVHV